MTYMQDLEQELHARLESFAAGASATLCELPDDGAGAPAANPALVPSELTTGGLWSLRGR
jgi:hypothetical protein